MRSLSLVLLLLVCADCRVSVPMPRGVSVSVNTTVRAHAQVVPAAPPVPMEGAAVVEFFGIPLDGAQDVVFVLDRSGSMEEPALGRIAQISGHIAPADLDASAPGASAPDASAPGASAPGASAPGASAPDASDPDALPEAFEPPDPLAAGAPLVPEDPQAPIAPPPAPRKIDVAHAELIAAIEGLPAGTRMNVLFFNDQLEAYATTMVPLEDSGREELVGFVRGSFPSGRTALAPAMRTAMLMNARRVVLLSDGLGNLGGGFQAVLRDAREAMRGGLRIDTIGLGNHQDAQLLETLANESGGLYQAL